MSSTVNILGAPEIKLVCMQASTFNPVLRCYDDAEKEEPTDLGGSTFAMQVRDKAANVILEFSTEEDGGITIQNVNELAFNKSAEDLDVTPGTYRYDLIETTYEGEVLPVMYGDFVIVKKQTALPTE